MNPKFLSSGLDLIKQFEGFSPKAYQDGAGNWTVGYGFTQGVKEGDTITQGDATLRLLSEIATRCNSVQRIIPNLSDNQFTAIVCFVYNVGTGNFMQSTLLKYLKQGRMVDAANEMLVWDKVDGRPCDGLLRRRAAERALFLGLNEDGPGAA